MLSLLWWPCSVSATTRAAFVPRSSLTLAVFGNLKSIADSSV